MKLKKPNYDLTQKLKLRQTQILTKLKILKKLQNYIKDKTFKKNLLASAPQHLESR